MHPLHRRSGLQFRGRDAARPGGPPIGQAGHRHVRQLHHGLWRPRTKAEPEWNVRADAKAGQALVASGAKLTLAGLDTTTMVKLGEADRTRLLYRNSPLTDAWCGLYIVWRYERYARPDPTLFDVVPLGIVLWPELFTSRPARVRVTDKGMTELVEGAPPNCEIGLTVNTDELIKRIMDRYLKQNLMRPPSNPPPPQGAWPCLFALQGHHRIQ